MNWNKQSSSPDLNPIDYFFGGHLENSIHDGQLYNTKESLQNAIMEAFGRITGDQIRNSIKNFEHRLGFCSAAQGRQFEHEI